MERATSFIDKVTEFLLSPMVFFIYGRNDNDLATVEKFLGTLCVRAVSLHTQGVERSVIDQSQELSDPAFVVALLTPEDIADYLKESKTGKIKNEHRVVFDLAYFVHIVGAKNICVLYKGDVERSFEPRGVSYVSLDDEDWTNCLAHTMKVAWASIESMHLESELQTH